MGIEEGWVCVYKYGSPLQESPEAERGCEWWESVGSWRETLLGQPCWQPCALREKKGKRKMVEFVDLSATMCYRLSFRMSLLGFYCPMVK